MFWSEGGPGHDGYRAALVFRVGRADETLARGGMTHLIEHLVLHAVGETDYHHNGAVDAATTMFITHGEAADVTGFLTKVCDSLRDLPMERFEAEKNMLRTEAEGRNAGLTGQLLLWRYGAATYGLPAYDEHGLADCTSDDVRAWAARWFTRQNAALALIGGPPPEGLELALPDGERRPVPEPTSALPGTPAYFNTDIKGVALTGVVPHSSEAFLYTDVLGRRLHQVLRRKARSVTPPTPSTRPSHLRSRRSGHSPTGWRRCGRNWRSGSAPSSTGWRPSRWTPVNWPKP